MSNDNRYNSLDLIEVFSLMVGLYDIDMLQSQISDDEQIKHSIGELNSKIEAQGKMLSEIYSIVTGGRRK